jgi:hypothetical protein
MTERSEGVFAEDELGTREPTLGYELIGVNERTRIYWRSAE